MPITTASIQGTNFTHIQRAFVYNYRQFIDHQKQNSPFSFFLFLPSCSTNCSMTASDWSGRRGHCNPPI